MDDKTLEKGYQLTFDNAKQLIHDADTLKNNERYQRAYTLYQLAIEEIGKCRILWKAIIEFYHGKQISVNYLKKNGFFKHTDKTQKSLMSELSAIWLYELSSGKDLEEMKSQITEDYKNVSDINLLKNRSLYVDIEASDFVSPVDSITKNMIAKIEQKAKIRFRAEEPIMKPLSEMKETAQNIMSLEKDPEKLKSVLSKYM